MGRLLRPAFWTKFTTVLTSLNTAPYIQHKLEYGILQWQQRGQDSAWPILPPPYHDTIGRLTHIAYFEQEQLGWEQALRGRLSRKWGKAQDQYYKDRFPNNLHTGSTWTTKVISALWEYSKDIWMERNAAYHGVDAQDAKVKRSDDLIVRSYQLDQHHVAFAHTPLFKSPIETYLKQNDDAKRSWLRSIDAVLTGYRIRVPDDPTPRTTKQLWQGTTITTQHCRLRNETK